MRKYIVAAGLAALALLVGAVAAPAQILTLYYQEVEKDGRIYVFNSTERASSFLASGEIGTAITLIGKAEGGKTLVAENETAADLYFFKHDLPGWERPAPKPERKFDDRVYWKDGKTTIEMKQAKIAISNRLQLRYAYFDAEDPTVDDRGSFFVRRAKTAIEGETTDKAWKFKLQANWVGAGYLTAASLVTTTPTPTLSTTVRRGPELEDAEVWWQKHGMAKVWVGQGKVPFGRQQFTSSGKQQFVDRWIGDALYAPGRDQGIRVEGHERVEDVRVLPRRLQRHRPQHPAQRQRRLPLLRTRGLDAVRRVQVRGELARLPRHSEARARPRRPRQRGRLRHRGDRRLASGLRGGLQVAGPQRGGRVLRRGGRTGRRDLGQPGLLHAAGYLFPGRKFEIAGRLGNIERDTTFVVANLAGALRDLEERGVAVSYYLDKHTHKIQADYIQLDDKVANRTLDELRIQLQVIF